MDKRKMIFRLIAASKFPAKYSPLCDLWTDRKKSGLKVYFITLASRKGNTEAKLCFANACEVRKPLSQKHEGDLFLWNTISINSLRVVKQVSQNFRMERLLDGWSCIKTFPCKHSIAIWGGILRKNSTPRKRKIIQHLQTSQIISNGTYKKMALWWLK